MSNPQPPFNCPRRVVLVQRAHDAWCSGSEYWGTQPRDYWPATVPKPRVCSYCHGVHPDDVIPLLVAGWEFERTDKPYKFYVQPPRGQEAPRPPVKAYLMHWTQQQVMRADEVMRAHRSFAANIAERSH
jgi:hypothetical protein